MKMNNNMTRRLRNVNGHSSTMLGVKKRFFCCLGRAAAHLCKILDHWAKRLWSNKRPTRLCEGARSPFWAKARWVTGWAFPFFLGSVAWDFQKLDAEAGRQQRSKTQTPKFNLSPEPLLWRSAIRTRHSPNNAGVPHRQRRASCQRSLKPHVSCCPICNLPPPPRTCAMDMK